MKKIFFMCTHCNQGTGYARSANKVTNHLAKTHEIVYYAFQNYKNQDITDRYIDPSIRFIDAIELDPESPKGFGDRGIIPSFENEKPDYLMIYNDINVCYSILKLFENSSWKDYKVVLYVDLVYPWEDVNKIRWLSSKCEKFYVFLDCWVDHLKLMGVQSEALKLGVDHEKFSIVQDSKKFFGFKEDDFIILNFNRNSHRKQMPVTIKAFLMLFKKYSNVKLFLSCVLNNEDGFDILNVIRTQCIAMGLDYDHVVNNQIFVNNRPTALTEENVNLLYNACDVGINTCHGEGFGMTNLEHALLGKPQVVTGVPAIKETLGPVALIVEPKVWTTVNNQESHGGELAVTDPVDFMEALEKVYLGKHTCDGYRNHVLNNWGWDDKLKVLDGYFINGCVH